MSSRTSTLPLRLQPQHRSDVGAFLNRESGWVASACCNHFKSTCRWGSTVPNLTGVRVQGALASCRMRPFRLFSKGMLGCTWPHATPKSFIAAWDHLSRALRPVSAYNPNAHDSCLSI
jgi:hypothetical protein